MFDINSPFKPFIDSPAGRWLGIDKHEEVILTDQNEHYDDIDDDRDRGIGPCRGRETEKCYHYYRNGRKTFAWKEKDGKTVEGTRPKIKFNNPYHNAFVCETAVIPKELRANSVIIPNKGSLKYDSALRARAQEPGYLNIYTDQRTTHFTTTPTRFFTRLALTAIATIAVGYLAYRSAQGAYHALASLTTSLPTSNLVSGSCTPPLLNAPTNQILV